jgi:hypothetical protein
MIVKAREPDKKSQGSEVLEVGSVMLSPQLELAKSAASSFLPLH